MPAFDFDDRRLLDDVIPLAELTWPVVEDEP
jgi:hypothetical protein